ncbi:GreA/GreB family elongation factor [Winogradskyella sediminis]|uniref:Transcription elongation factor, GreA/GreB, C-term n=1 Tax=Winogradskyella sediminis TaxID=1382466 RepID=A0A1H1RPT9_9FLAO|nr:GreA/GreB family elongation factor [Winogradskyella sediminis]REG89470.1 GreA/GreB family transcription elongation factor [Winogradskyella sediminis]SDS37612.1 Transcription elongation factor, GreA/GreB, C-term [Winogradskyella sediminis]
MTVKEALYQSCSAFLENRLITVRNTILDIQTSLQSETKSSAGDKHETGRAMLQLEREKAGCQLAEIEKQQHVLQKIDIGTKSSKVGLGSVVKTTQFNYFIAVSAGEFTINNTSYFAISSATPIAQLLLSKQIGDEVVFRTQKFKIIEII